METLSLNLANQTSAFSDKNAGVAKTVTVAGIRLSGTDAGNDVLNTTCLLKPAATRARKASKARGVIVW